RLVMETYMEMLKVIGITGGDLTKEVYISPGADEKVEEFFLKTIYNKIPPNPPFPKGRDGRIIKFLPQTFPG
ncbi:MAG: hypothetical protein Q7V12_01110, partial [Deltaproteobacteria bacterium]|nr:hypothetical protein [Deltaproteobacteria bacterium]